MLDPSSSRWVRIASQCEVPGRADWGQQSESSTLRTSGLAILVWTAVITSLKVSLIQYQECPHEHCLQHLHWKITQWRLQWHHMDFSHWSADTFLLISYISVYTRNIFLCTHLCFITCASSCKFCLEISMCSNLPYFTKLYDKNLSPWVWYLMFPNNHLSLDMCWLSCNDKQTIKWSKHHDVIHAGFKYHMNII